MEKQNAIEQHDKKKEIWFILTTVFFFAFTLLFYGPLGLYLANAQELWFDLKMVLKIVLFTSLVAMAILIPVLVFTKKTGLLITKILLGITLGLYIQGTYINIKYGTGVADGSSIDWKNYTKYGVADTLLWIVLLALPFVIEKLFKEKKYSIFIGLALFLSAVQIPAAVVQLVNYTPSEQGAMVISTEGFDEFGQENIIVFGLDTIDEAYYKDFIEKNPEYIENLDGFVHYDNTLAAGGRTILAVPSILTGEPFVYDDSYNNYLQKVWDDDCLLSQIHQKGYDVRCFVTKYFFSTNCVNFIDNFKIQNSDGDIVSLGKKLYKLDMFTFLPHYLKPKFEFVGNEFEEVKTVFNEYKLNDSKNYEAFIKNGARLSKKYDKSFRMYLLNGAHHPYTMTSTGEDTKEDTSLEEQMAGCMLIMSKFLQNLKDLGIYDSSTIIIMADHGDKNVAEHPFMMIKRANDTEPYRTSHVPASQFDLPLLFSKLTGVELKNNTYGMDIDELTDGMDRERFYFYNRTLSSRVAIEKYSTSGDAGDYEAIKQVEVLEAKDLKNTPYVLGKKLKFNIEGSGNQYTVSGFWGRTGLVTWVMGPYAELQIPIEDLPSDGELLVRFTLAKYFQNPTNLVVKANGVEVFNGYIDKEHYSSKNIEFAVPIKEVFKENNVLNLTMDLPDIPEVPEEIFENPDLDVEECTEFTSFAVRFLTIEAKN